MVYLSVRHQTNCVLRPIASSLTGGCLFTAFDYASGNISSTRAVPRQVAFYATAIYSYNILQCPMEAFNNGRPSAWHNVFSGAILGYIGVQRRLLGVPFVDAYFFYRHPQISPPIAGAAVYGIMGGVLASVLGHKQF